MRFFSVLFFLVTSPLLGRTFTEDFSSTSQLDKSNSTGVWNAALKRLTVPNVVDRDFGGVSEDTILDLGDASDGSFSASTMYQLDMNQGSSPGLVSLSTTTAWEFSTFTLPQGITVRGVGTNPLIIRVQGDVVIAGRLDVRGSSGGAPEDNTTHVPAGGTGGPGGGRGGNGGVAGGVSAEDGEGSGPGRWGASNNSGLGGAGGGGGYAANGSNGASGGAAGGAGGAAYLDNLFDESTVTGGSGGGGGGGSGSQDFPAGGAGGGGGGALVLTAGGHIQLTSTGSILAYGGDGGVPDTEGTENCTSGGGGSGGAIALFAGGLITNEGFANARAGFGGSGECQVQGGDGSVGRARFVDASATLSAHGSPELEIPDPTNSGTPWGQVFHSTSGPYLIQSLPYDLQNTSPTFNSISWVGSQPAGSTFTLEVAGSNDNFQNSDTGFVDHSLISQLSGNRYLRFRLTLKAADRSDPPYLSAISLDYTPSTPGTFKVKQSCASIHWEAGKGDRMSWEEESQWPAAIWFFAVLGYLLSLSFVLPVFLRRIQSSTSKANRH